MHACTRDGGGVVVSCRAPHEEGHGLPPLVGNADQPGEGAGLGRARACLYKIFDQAEVEWADGSQK